MDTESPKISVIVAVYKAEKYIRRCLDSILAQTFTDYEVILVDDGSPDKSGEICDEYARKDSRFKVIHKSNDGVASARQCGIDNVIGKYSIHVDPDDWVEPDYLEVLYNKIVEEDADLCCCNFIYEYKRNSIRSISKINPLKTRKNINPIIMIYGGFLWNKLIRNEIYYIHGILFPYNVSVGEDEIVVEEILSHKPKITFTDRYLYHYDRVINTSAITTSYDMRLFKIEEKKFNRLCNSKQSKTTRSQGWYLIGEMAHNAFLYKLMNHQTYVQYFKKYIFCIMRSNIPIWRKINILFAFMGMGDIIQPLYLWIKKNI